MMNNRFNLSGKRIIVTGASSGIGRQCAVSFSASGAELLLLDKNEEGLIETQNMIGTGCQVLPVNLTDYPLVETSVEKIKSTFGKIDGLVNCIGISSVLPIGFLTPEELGKFFTVNVIASTNLTRLLLKGGMNRGGSIVFIASVMSIVGESGKTHYSMTKGALLSGVRSMALELAGRNIRVNTISPGVIVTPINANLPHIADPQKRQETESRHPLGLGEPEDIANGCQFLLSDASKWMTGQNLVIDGGYSIK